VTQGRRWLACILFLGALTLGVSLQASAHAFLNASVPGADSTVATPLTEVKLTYSEPVEIRFSIFKVYRLNAAPGADLPALHAAAEPLVAADLLKRGDEADRSDAGVANTTRSSADIVVRLKELVPGTYVLMWRALSVDTHTTQGSFIFIYAPGGGSITRIPEGDVPAMTGGVASDPLLWQDTADLSESPADIRAQSLTIDAALQPTPQPTSGSAPAREDPPFNIQASGVLMYRLFYSPNPPVAGGDNLNALSPVPAFPTIHDGILETALTWTFSPTLNLFADLTLENTTGADFSPSDIEELYLDARGLFGLAGLDTRLGRDRVKLGPTGLLVDETVFDGGRRDGLVARLSQEPVSVSGFVQYALDDGLQVGNWTSTRRVWGASLETAIVPGWTIDVSYRADTAGAAEVGPCPGIGCNVGSGFSAGVEGDLVPGVNLIMEAATYTQLGDVARWYYEPSVALDLKQLFGLDDQPVLTFWYKSFDPYTLPLDAPLGHLLIPGDFGTFNTNDNLTAVGTQLDLSFTPALSAFGLAEWGTYKNGGPSYTVFSIGARYNFTSDFVVKVSYNSYTVGGGVVTTSPVSGLQLSNAQIYLLEVTKSF
jgi:copper resistance protein C